MGKSWFTAVKKALSPEAKEKKQEKPRKAKKWFGKHKKMDTVGSHAVPSPKRQPELAPMAVEDVKLAEVKDEQTRYAYSAALATAVAAEAAVAAAQAAAEVVRLTASSCFPGKPKEEIAAIKIQTAFRGYMARRGLRALRGLVRLKTLIQGQSVRRQATSVLQCIQTLARVQYQIRERRLLLSADKQARVMKQLQKQKHEKDPDKVGENWDYSTLSKEQIQANMLNKHVAAMRRERALAYSFSHQKSASKSGHQTFMDPSNPHWGWSWMERWMAARPCENPSATALDSNDKSSVKSSASRAVTEIIPRTRNPSPKGRKPIQRRRASGEGEDTGSMMSIQSEQPCHHHRHSICGSGRDDESITSCSQSQSQSQSQSVPSYMAHTRATMARARFSSLSPVGSDKAKKRLSFSGSSPRTVRRFSGPPKLESNGMKESGGR